MNRFLRSRLILIGLAVLLLGTGPFISVLLGERFGVAFDPELKRARLGVMAWIAAWPGVTLIILGVWRARKPITTP